MSRIFRLRNILAAGCAGLTAATAAPTLQAAPQGRSPAVVDGVPNRELCATLGIGVRTPTTAYYAAPLPIVAPAPAPMLQQREVPPPATAAPPPPPPPFVARPAPREERVGITSSGTFVRGAAEASALPVEVIGRADLQAQGSPATDQLVRDLSKQGLVQSQSANGANAGGMGVSSLNLGNLGNGRTLVTLNGRRVGDDPNIQPGATFPGTEAYPDKPINAIKQVADEPVSTFSIDVDTASYANVRRFLRDGIRPPTDAVRIEELVNYFDYAYAQPTGRDSPFRPYLAIAPSPWAKDKQLIHIGVQGFKPPPGQMPPLNLVFLVDTSGSMGPADRLPLAQKTLNVLIDQLRPQDTVSMVVYAGSAGAVLSPTRGHDKLRMRCAVDALQSGGSTAGGAGLQLAYGLAQQNFNKSAVNRVVLMTDGDFNVGVTDNKRLEDFVADKRKTGVYLSVYGFGRGNYQDARMQVLAQNGNGTAAYVDSLDEGRKLMRDDFEGSMFPIADDVKIQVEFNPAAVSEYRLIGYETRMLRREDFNNDRIDAGEVGAGVAVTALYEVTRKGGAPSVDPLRYGVPVPTGASGPANELGYLKIRYKLPGGTTSKLIEQPINQTAAYPSIDRAPEATRWAASVAAYGQKLRNDPYVGSDFTWDEALSLAQGARGDDRFGIRAEFINLVRAARDLQTRSAGL